MVRTYYDEQADVADIAFETVAIIGYGIQGQAQACNLRDSGLKVVIGNRADPYRDRANADGFEVQEIPDAAASGDIILLLIPDEAQADIYRQYIHQTLTPGKALVFAHGFAIRYGLIQPPDFVDLLLLAPRMPGKYVRDLFLRGGGVPAYVYVGQDYTGRALKRVLALARGIGATRAGVLEMNFAQELELDHFSEHFTFPLIVRALQLAYEVLTEEGYPAEAVLMELHGSGELGEVLREAARIGLYTMIETHASPACQFGIHSYPPSHEN
ncbi:MAG: NAD(P)-binding domain-containing protein [Candidatus Binatia bacterium]